MASKTERVAYEDALTMTGFGKFNVLIFLLNASVIVAMAFETFSVAYLVPASACEFHTDNSQQGIMAAVPMIGIIAASHIWGYLADTRGRRNMLSVSLVLGFITASLATFSPNWIVFSALKCASASSLAGTFGLSIAYLGECTPAAKRNRLIVMTSSVFVVSTGVMGMLTIPVLSMTFSFYIPYLDIHFNAWRLLNFIFTIPCLFSAIALHYACESPKFFLSNGDEDKSLNIVKNIFAINTGKSPDEFQVTAIYLDEDLGSSTKEGLWASMVNQTVPLMKPPLLKNTILLSVLYIAVYICVQPYMVWMPFMADAFMRAVFRGETNSSICDMIRASQNETVVTTSDSCALNSTAMFVMFGLGCFIATLNIILVILMPYIGTKNLLIGIQLISGVAALSINSFSYWIISAVLLFMFLTGVLNFGYLSTFTVDIFPTYVKAMAVCFTLMVGRGSAVLGINLLKVLLAENCEASFYIFGGITFASGLLAFLLPVSKPTQKKCPET